MYNQFAALLSRRLKNRPVVFCYTTVTHTDAIVKMSKNKTDILCEKGTGSELFTSREAARFLDYHPVAFRRLVSTGKVRMYSRTGNYPLFLREELEKYQATNKWAGKKARLKGRPAQTPAHTGNKGILAVVTASRKGKEIVVENLAGFKWGDVPAILARVAAKYGKIPFRITLELPDGTGVTILFHTSAPKAEARKKLPNRKNAI